MASTEGSGQIIIQRGQRSLLRRKAAHVIIQSRTVTYFPGDVHLFEVPAGEVTLLLYPDKKLTFVLKAGETVNLTIGESAYTLGFLLFHGLGILGVILLWAMSLAYGNNRDTFFLLAVIATFTQVRTMRRQWFYMEEKI